MTMNEFEIVKFQVITHCFISDIYLNDTEFNLMALLGTQGQIRLIDFCRLAMEKGFLGTEISVNNCLSKIERTKLFLKKGVGKKIIYLNPDLNIIYKGTIVLDYIIVKRDESQKVAG